MNFTGILQDTSLFGLQTGNGKSLDRMVFVLSLSSLVVCGLVIVFINVGTKDKAKRQASLLTRSLWKFNAKLSQEKRRDMFIWAWRKLLAAGLMVGSLVVSMGVKHVGSFTAIAYAASVVALWSLALWIVWFFVFVPGISESSDDVDSVNITEKQSEDATQNSMKDGGWEGRKRGSTGSVDSRLPITVITGFLGSGKTTLVKNILHNTLGLKILVIENEIGTEGIDHELLMQDTKKEDIVVMNNGCICCTVRRDLLVTFHRLFKDEAFSRLDWVVIETTGLADPAPLIQTLYMDEECKRRLRLDAVLGVVDAKHFGPHFEAFKGGRKGAHGGVPEAVQQVAFADRVILNKSDLVDPEELERVAGHIHEVNPSAHVFTCAYSKVPIVEVLNIRAFDASKNSGLLSSSLSASSAPKLIQIDREGKILKKKVKFGRPPASTDQGSGEKGVGGDGISTLSLTCAAPLELDKINVWIANLLRTNGTGLFRLKGILSMSGYDRQFVAHGIHMVFDGELGPQWGPESSRGSRLVLIGMGLDHAALEKTFLECQA